MAAKALYQAFVVARDRRDTKTMIEAGHQILDEYGESDFAKDVLSSLGDDAVRSTEFSRGATYYEEFARRFAQDSAAADLLASAAKMRQFLGDYSGAMTDYERLANIGGADSARYFAEMAGAAEEAGEWRRVILAASPILSDPSFGVEARARAGLAMYKTGQEGDAAATLMSVVQDAPPGSAQGEQAHYAARRSLLPRRDIAHTASPRCSSARVMTRRSCKRSSASWRSSRGQYVNAIKYGDPEYAIGALYRLGEAYREAATFLDSAPAPEGISAEELQAYRNALKEQSDEYRVTSKQTFKTCREKTVKLSAFNRYAKGCLTEKELAPESDHAPARQEVEIPSAVELRARIAKSSKDIDALVDLARAANGVGDYYYAKLVASKALEVNDGNALAHNALAVADIQLGNYQAAYYSLKRAKDVDSRLGAVQANLGALYHYVGDTKRARSAFSNAGGKVGGPDVAAKAREAAASLGG